ncbi:hypothetical protein GXP71_10805 [Cellulomonas sp. H30R-01]|uniref:hypothetical protein n=1 Tax=Cellulomonas sp. H30R-01 TaxID=2704467 RepID=UPI00138D5FB1|nr:hypothetical protein [Cellulomonas sp. H30R-01]QHT56514.1 hypothetical protein GXP71_10805 [Cellulomonas sp. H30R-01]
MDAPAAEARERPGRSPREVGLAAGAVAVRMVHRRPVPPGAPGRETLDPRPTPQRAVTGA